MTTKPYRPRVRAQKLPIATITEINRLADQGFGAAQIKRDLDLPVTQRTVQRYLLDRQPPPATVQSDPLGLHDLADALRELAAAIRDHHA